MQTKNNCEHQLRLASREGKKLRTANKLPKVLGLAGSYIRWMFSSLINVRVRDWNRELVIVTGADSSHFLSLCQFLSSAVGAEPRAKIVVWDLGLTAEESGAITNQFPSAHFRKFPYERYPSYFQVTKAKGEYAWKPVAISLSAQELSLEKSGKMLMWCDAGNVLFKPLRWVRMYAGKHGVYAPFSRGDISQWTHPETIKYFGLTSDQVSRSNCASGLVVFDFTNPQAQNLLGSWADLAARREVIAPPGSSRKNHRQDQAVLSCLLVKNGFLPDGSYRTNWTEEYLTGRDVEGGKQTSSRQSIWERAFEHFFQPKG